MKKSIYILGIVCINITLFGMLFKLNHWPGAGIMLVLGLATFIFGFLPMSIFNSYNGNEKKRTALFVTGFISAFIIFLGVIFKIQHFPGANIFLIIGVPLPFILFLPVYIYFHNKEQSKTNTSFLGVMLLLVYIAVYSAMLSINISKTILNSFVNYHDEFSTTTTVAEMKNSALFDALSKTENEKISTLVNEIKTKSNELCNTIDANKVDYVHIVEGENSVAIVQNQDNKNSKINLSGIFNKDQICSFVNDDVLKLKDQVNSYRDYLKNILNDRKISSATIDSLLNTTDVHTKYSNGIITWEQDLFASKYLVSLLTNFSLIQSNIRIAEMEVLSELQYTK